MSSQYSNPNVNPHFKLPWKPLTTYIMTMKTCTFISKLCFSILQTLLGFYEIYCTKFTVILVVHPHKIGLLKLKRFFAALCTLCDFTQMLQLQIYAYHHDDVGFELEFYCTVNAIKVKSSWSVYLHFSSKH